MITRLFCTCTTYNEFFLGAPIEKCAKNVIIARQKWDRWLMMVVSMKLKFYCAFFNIRCLRLYLNWFQSVMGTTKNRFSLIKVEYFRSKYKKKNNIIKVSRICMLSSKIEFITYTRTIIPFFVCRIIWGLCADLNEIWNVTWKRNCAHCEQTLLVSATVDGTFLYSPVESTFTNVPMHKRASFRSDFPLCFVTKMFSCLTLKPFFYI